MAVASVPNYTIKMIKEWSGISNFSVKLLITNGLGHRYGVANVALVEQAGDHLATVRI